MKKTLFTIALVLMTTVIFAQVNPNYHYVNPYTKSNGTVVQGYYKTNPNSTINDNYSTEPNVNPWTGNYGTVSRSYSYPTYSNPTYSSPKYESTPTYNLPSNNSLSDFYSSPYSYPSYSLPSLPSLSTYDYFRTIK